MRKRFSNGRIRVVVGLVLFAGLLIQCQWALNGGSSQEGSPVVLDTPLKPSPSMAVASLTQEQGVAMESLAQADPIRFLEEALSRYDRSVRDYTCTFSKQEFVGSKLSSEQVMNAFFREKPYSVRLEWTKNADKCARVLYVADRWLDDKGNQMAVVEPGAIARLFVPYVMRQIDGKDAQKSSRRTINQFGLRNSLVLTLKFAKLGIERGVGTMSYMGNSKVDGRETLVFERHLPYVDENGEWPDRVLVVNLDKQLLLPVQCTAFADDAKKTLLGNYKCTNIKLNANLADSVFTKEGMGL